MRKQDRLLKEGITLVNQVTKNFCFKYRVKDREELCSFLLEKLIRVIDNYDESKGNFKVFAVRSLYGYSLNFLRDNCRIIKVPRKHLDVYLMYNRLKKQHSGLTLQAAADKLGIKLSVLEKALEAASLTFCEISDHHMVGTTEQEPIFQYIRDLPTRDREILEDIFLDRKSREKTYLKYGLSPHRGNELIENHILNLRQQI
jgi:RNA polymerase sigma factor (sigma-70 family)